MPTAIDSSLTNASPVAPVSLVTPWLTVIAAGEVATADSGGTITDPEVDIERDEFEFPVYGGTTLLLSLGYDPALTSITAPVLNVFGRASSADTWRLLLNRADTPSADITLTPAATDALTDGIAYTTVNLKSHALDCTGCKKFKVGVKTALNGSTGVETNSVVQAKCL